jgi:hypothetical protein
MFSVEWVETALNDLANLWTQADPLTRSHITSATNAIDRRLALNGPGEGESRIHGRRILFEFPLGIIFRIDLALNQAVVLHVWRFGPRNQQP